MNAEIFAKALALLENVTPLKNDCGLLCERACCQSDPDVGGDVWLFPYENELEYDWAEKRTVRLPVTGERAGAIRCSGACNRSLRPFCCRIFPLSPVFSKKKNEWSVRMDRRAMMVCPLCEYGLKALSPEFVNAAKEAVRLLATDPECERFLLAIYKEESAYRNLGAELGLT